MKLQEYLDSNGMKKNWFAEMIGISPQYFGQICNGIREPSLSIAVKICKMTRGAVDVTDLILDKKP